MVKPYYESGGITIYHGDCYQLWGELKSESFDCIITDPPYWTLNKWRNMGTTTRLGGHREKENQTGWFPTIDEGQLWELMGEMHRLLKPDCHAYLMTDGQTLKWVLGYAEEAGFASYKPIVWDKVNQGMGYHYRCRHEYFVMLDKGRNRRLNDLSTPDICRVPMIRGGWPTEKPVDLMAIPAGHSTSLGDTVLDLFMGSGSVLLACAQLGRKAVGVEIQEAACERAAKRLEELLKPKEPLLL